MQLNVFFCWVAISVSYAPWRVFIEEFVFFISKSQKATKVDVIIYILIYSISFKDIWEKNSIKTGRMESMFSLKIVWDGIMGVFCLCFLLLFQIAFYNKKLEKKSGMFVALKNKPVEESEYIFMDGHIIF